MGYPDPWGGSATPIDELRSQTELKTQQEVLKSLVRNRDLKFIISPPGMTPFNYCDQAMEPPRKKEK